MIKESNQRTPSGQWGECKMISTTDEETGTKASFLHSSGFDLIFAAIPEDLAPKQRPVWIGFVPPWHRGQRFWAFMIASTKPDRNFRVI